MAEPYRRHWVVVGGLVLYWAELSQTEKAVCLSMHVSNQPLLAEEGTRGYSPRSIANRLSGTGRVSLFGSQFTRQTNGNNSSSVSPSGLT